MDPLMDKEQLAELLNVEVTWVRDAITARILPITWVGKHARFDLIDITAWLESNKELPAAVVASVVTLATGPRPPAGPAQPPRPAGPATPSKRGRVA